MKTNFAFDSINFSPQQRLVTAGSTLWIPVYKVNDGYNFLIESIDLEFFDEIAEQDCVGTIFVANKEGTYTGLRTDPTKTEGTFNLRAVTEDRTFGGADTYLGGKQTVSSASGVTKPDNFGFSFTSFQTIVTEGKDIYWKIQNQSASFDHAVIVSMKGFQFKGNICSLGDCFPLTGSPNVSKRSLKQRCKIIEQFSGTLADATTRTGTPSTVLGLSQVTSLVSSDQNLTLNIVSGIDTTAPLAGLPADTYAVVAGVPLKLILPVGENWLRYDLVNASGALANIELLVFGKGQT